MASVIIKPKLNWNICQKNNSLDQRFSSQRTSFEVKKKPEREREHASNYSEINIPPTAAKILNQGKAICTSYASNHILHIRLLWLPNSRIGSCNFDVTGSDSAAISGGRLYLLCLSIGGIPDGHYYYNPGQVRAHRVARKS